MIELSRATQERHRYWPLSRGTHTVEEIAVLLGQGKSLREVAALWGLRPRAGVMDLQKDIWKMWESAGCPGGLPKPEGWDKEEWTKWRAARGAALEPWIMSHIANGIPAHHCPTCRCIEVPQ